MSENVAVWSRLNGHP